MNELLLMARIAGQDVAIRSDQVESVVDIVRIVPVPRAPAPVRGLAALRSRVVTVVDAAIALGDRTLPLTPRRRAVVTQIDGHPYALLVDRLEDVVTHGPVPLTQGLVLAPMWASVVDAMIERDGEPVPVLDLPAVIARVIDPGAARAAA